MWFQLRIEQCPTEAVEPTSEELEALGALSVSLSDKNDDPILEPAPGETPLWPEVIIQALFNDEEQAKTAASTLMAHHPHLEITHEQLPDQDWERAWMDDFKPQQFGKRLWICPSWCPPPEPDAVNLMLDPGLAFGTGTHPTTALCLTWLEGADLSHKQLIDFGCGSGILSIAALKLGAKNVHAVDIDEQALQATKNNAMTNQVSGQQLVISMPEALSEPVDLIMANILLEPLMSLKLRFHELLKAQGQLVVSGILTEQEPILMASYQDHFAVTTCERLDGWSLIVFSKIAA